MEKLEKPIYIDQPRFYDLYNVKGIEPFKKRIKIFEHLKNAIASSGFIFLEETRSPMDDEKKCNDVFKGKLFFSHDQRILAESLLVS